MIRGSHMETSEHGPVATPAAHAGRKEGRLAVLLEIATILVVGIVGVSIAGTLAPDRLVARQGVVWVANVGMLLLVWYFLRRRGQGWLGIGLAFEVPKVGAVAKAALASLAVVILAVVAFAASGALVQSLWEPTVAADMSRYTFLEGNLGMLLLTLAGAYIVSSMGEEIIYRGFLMTRVAEFGGGGKAAWCAALVVGAVIFGLAHYAWGPVGMVQTGFMGLVLGGAYLVVGRNLWVCVLAHACMDTLLFVPLYLGGSGPG